MTDLLSVGVAPVEVHPDGYRIPGVDRLITVEASQHAKTKGAVRYSPAWRLLALSFCAARDAATEDVPPVDDSFNLRGSRFAAVDGAGTDRPGPSHPAVTEGGHVLAPACPPSTAPESPIASPRTGDSGAPKTLFTRGGVGASLGGGAPTGNGAPA